MIIHHDPRDGVALAAFKSEWWPASRRNSGRLQIGTPGRLRRNTQLDPEGVSANARKVAGTGMPYVELMGFGPNGWGPAMLAAAGVTLAVALCAFLIGGVVGVLGAWAKLSDGTAAQLCADAYTTVLRGVPDLLILYLFY